MLPSPPDLRAGREPPRHPVIDSHHTESAATVRAAAVCHDVAGSRASHEKSLGKSQPKSHVPGPLAQSAEQESLISWLWVRVPRGPPTRVTHGSGRPAALRRRVSHAFSAARLRASCLRSASSLGGSARASRRTLAPRHVDVRPPGPPRSAPQDVRAGRPGRPGTRAVAVLRGPCAPGRTGGCGAAPRPQATAAAPRRRLGLGVVPATPAARGSVAIVAAGLAEAELVQTSPQQVSPYRPSASSWPCQHQRGGSPTGSRTGAHRARLDRLDPLLAEPQDACRPLEVCTAGRSASRGPARVRNSRWSRVGAGLATAVSRGELTEGCGG